MNLKQGAVLLVMFISYLLIGGAIFMQFEGEPKEQENPTYGALLEFRDILLSNESRDLIGADDFIWKAHVNFIFNNLTEREEYKNNQTVGKWSFYDATFFCLTVVTTIGYGNKTPTNERSRGFCIFYALLGIPLTGIWIAGVGNFLSKKLLKAHEKTKSVSTRSPRFSLLINTVTYLIPGFLIFLILPASIFMALEEWTFLDSFYYTVVTLTTIGFGDFVAGQGDGEYKWMYKVILMIWIIFGLGYLSMILNFIAKAMKSKHVKKIERSLTKNLKQTQEAFAKEVEFLVKSLNVYMNKVKSKQEEVTLEKTNSCPSLNDLDESNSTLRNSFVEPGKDHTETSANFIFDLAMAIACGELEREEEDTGSKVDVEVHQQQHSTNVAQLLTMALLPQLRGGNSNGSAASSTVNNTMPAPSGEKHRHIFDIFKHRDDSDFPKKAKTSKSNSVVEGFMFPFAPVAPLPSRLQKRRRSDMVTTSTEKELYKNGLLKQWETISKDIKALTNENSTQEKPSEEKSEAPEQPKKQQPKHNMRRHSVAHLHAIKETTTNNEEKDDTSTNTIIEMP